MFVLGIYTDYDKLNIILGYCFMYLTNIVF